MPSISIEVAYKWLNIDTYWNTPNIADPGDDQPQVVVPDRAKWQSQQPKPVQSYPAELRRKYPLVNPVNRSYPRQTRLHDPGETDLSVATLVEQLVSQLRQEIQHREWSEARAKISQIENICNALKANANIGDLLIAEAHLEFGRAYRVMGENARALECFEASLKEFQSGADRHAEALARWMAGYIQLETPKTDFDKGLVNWQTSWGIFVKFSDDRGNLFNKDEVLWYKRRADLMRADIDEVLKAQGIYFSAATASFASTSASPPPPGSTSPTTGGLTPTPHSAGVEGELFWWHSLTEAIQIVQVGGSASGYWAERLDGQDFPASNGLPVNKRHFFRHADFHAMLDQRELIWLPKPGTHAVGLPEPVIAEGEIFWWHSFTTAVRLSIVGGGIFPGVVMERLDGGEFPAHGDAPASQHSPLPLDVFKTMLESHELVWLPALEKAEPPAAESTTAESAPPRDSTGPSLAEAWLRLPSPRVFDSIAAHPAGRLVDEVEQYDLQFQADFVECDHILIGGLPYRIYDATSGARTIPKRLIMMQEGDHFVRVKGDSMNRAKPCPIEDGDYVLVRVNPQPQDNLIVAARLVGSKPDSPATIKRKRPDVLKSESSTGLRDIDLTGVARFVGEVIAVAKPEQDGKAIGTPT